MASRLDRLRAAMADDGLDGVYVSSPVDDVFGQHSQGRRYLAGFTGSSGGVLVTATQAILAVDFRYVEQAEREATPHGFSVWKTEGRQRTWLPKLLRDAGLARRGRALGVAAATMTYQEYLGIESVVRDLPVGQRPVVGHAGNVLDRLRRQKDAEELRLLQEAIRIADVAFERVSAALDGSETEVAVAAALEREVRAEGAEGMSFSTIVAGGPWGAMPHATPRPQPVGRGVPIVIDMGAQFAGYCSDLTRTFVAGEPDDTFKQVYSVVREAQEAAIRGIEAGMPGTRAHALAADVIGKAGYGERFGHGLGHGVGLEVHESPYLGATSEDTLEDGMVFTIEPGVYLPGWGGIRIEDVVVLEGGRARLLSHAPKLPY